MPFKDNVKVLTQFGRLPLSVMEFKNDSKWNNAYFEQDKEEQRRSDDSKYLPGLGMSEFSSAVCEFMVKYWSMKNATIIDPFAGRATRAVISTKLKRNYIGYEISPHTYNRSKEHFQKLDINPTLYLGDGCQMGNAQDESAHACITCPPYWNLEEYESTLGQLSDIKNYDDFLVEIDTCISNVYKVLKPGGFSCWVVADWRDSTGYKMFTNDVVNLFKQNRFIPHDTVIIKNNSPFAALMASKCASKRITSKIHETIVVFRKRGELDLTGLVEDEINEKANLFFS